jgi:1-deoxy-D-xylulose-5-phosphate synthase
MIAEAATHPLVITIEDGLRAGGGGEAMRDEISAIDHRVDVRVLGVPTQYIPHGKPDTILAALGLDAAGIVRTVDAARPTNPG